MHDVYVKLKNGQEYHGPMWTWRPKAGWFELAGDSPTIYLSDVLSAEGTNRTHVPRRDCPKCGEKCSGVERVDYLARAKQEGWDGSV